MTDLFAVTYVYIYKEKKRIIFFTQSQPGEASQFLENDEKKSHFNGLK